MNTWLLPEHIEDLLPAEAQKFEYCRRLVLDIFGAHGYALVVPPLMEYVESLLSSGGQAMDIKTFKLVDQLSGRMMGIRADTTPQVARIDAHLLNQQGVTRLCYAGSVLHTLPSGLHQSRQPFQVGAELYGYSGLEADIEIQQLMLDVLKAMEVPKVELDIGHAAILHSLIESAGVDKQQATLLFKAIQAKNVTALKPLVASLNQVHAQALLALPDLYGKADVLSQAAAILPATPVIQGALHDLKNIARHFMDQGITVSVDLAELSGAEYERGVVFAAFASGAADAIARGGRYDDVGRVFGRARPATGFSLDLKAILPLIADRPVKPGILAPRHPAPELAARIQTLRAAGEVVITQLDAAVDEPSCDRELRLVGHAWQIVPRATQQPKT